MSALQRVHDIETSAHDERSLRDIPFLIKAFRVMESLAKECWKCKRAIPHESCGDVSGEFERRMGTRQAVLNDKY